MVIKVLQKQKVRIPEDVAVIGYDNVDVAKLVSPSITTFDQNNDELSKAMVDLLLRVINGENIPPEKRNIIIEPLLIKRESA
jgi:DNA-binding LacI/PurR family transcriptional regulator